MKNYRERLFLALCLGTASPVTVVSQSSFWTSVPSLSSGNVQTILALPGNVVLVGLYNTGTQPVYGILLSTTDGDSWQSSNSGLLDTMLVSSLVRTSDGNILAAASTVGMSSMSRVYRSTDGGNSWSAIWEKPFHPLQALSLLSSPAKSIIVGTFAGGIFRSTNDGATWSQTYPDFFGNRFIYALASTPAGTILATAPAGGILRSTDDGATWTNPIDTLSTESILSIGVSRSGTVFVGTTQSGVFRSSDDGVTWAPLSASPHSVNIWALTVTPEGHVFAGTNGGVFRTTDAGEAWENVSTGLPSNSHVWALAVDVTGYLLAGHIEDGLFKSRQVVTATSPSESAAPVTPGIEQNYPNPFNPATTIAYELPAQTHVTLKVFNTLGQEVAVLVDELQTAGYKSVDFNAAGLPSGVYLYRLTAGDFVATKKCVVLK